MIPESTIRDERWNGAEFALDGVLDKIPLTREQRGDIDSCLYDMKATFLEANKETRNHEH